MSTVTSDTIKALRIMDQDKAQAFADALTALCQRYGVIVWTAPATSPTCRRLMWRHVDLIANGAKSSAGSEGVRA